MKKSILSFAFWLSIAGSAGLLQAQVTIGANTPPQSFSALELISGGDKGLRLPQMTTAQRDNLQTKFGTEATGKAMGLQIFNTKTKCVETWNGAAWIQVCPPSGPAIPPVSPTPPASCGVTASNGNTTFTCIADPNAEAYEFFLSGASQGEQATNSITFASAQTPANVSVVYLFPPAFLKPVMKDVAGNGGSSTWYWGTGTPPGTATTVSIPDFKMSETLVTQAQFSAVMGDVTPSYNFSCGGGNASSVTTRPTSALPAENVNWYAAIAYCNKLSIMEGKTPVYSVSTVSDWAALPYASIPTSTNTDWNAATCNFAANGYRLPTESEWEYAARGGTANAHPVFSGSAYAGNYSTAEGSDSLCMVAWFTGNNNTTTTCGTATNIYGTKPVKGKRANVFGLYDMSGNVFEWCWNWSNETFPMATPTTAVTPATSSLRVGRGGYWSDAASNCRVSARNNTAPSNRNGYMGFRVVLVP